LRTYSSSRLKNEKIIVVLLVAICLISATAIGIPKTIAKNESNPGLRKSDNPIMYLPKDKEKWLPIVPPAPVERPLDEDTEQFIEILVYDVNTKKTKKILKDITKSDKTTLKMPGYQGLLPSDLVPESVILPDDRVRITPTTGYPWRSIVKLRMTFPSGNYMGSGFIFGESHVLTAGHCVYSYARGEWATSIEVIPAYDGGYMPFSNAMATDWAVSTLWYENGWSSEDFAILTLDRNIGGYTGWMGLYTALPTDPIYTSILNTAGYPGDLDGGLNMYFDSDSGAGADEYNHWYYMDTYGGQSGSAVWSYDGTTHYVLTVHAYGTGWPSYPDSNAGTRLSEYWFSIIDAVLLEGTPTDYANLIDEGQAWSGFSPTPVMPGVSDFSVWSGTRNIGTIASGDFSVSYYASSDQTISDSDYLIGTVSVSSIEPYWYSDSEWTGTFPIDIPGGTYWLGWIIDSNNDVLEDLYDGETDNIAYKYSDQLMVESIVVSINVDPNDIGFGPINKGETGTETVTITTTGNTVAVITATLSGELPVDFYSDNLELDSFPIAGWSILSLAPDTPTLVFLDLYIPPGTAAGSVTANLIFWAEIPP